MASKLCCITEDERAGSPELPNVRLSQAVPTKRPPAPAGTSSENSHFMSECYGDLYELRDLFHNARQSDDSRLAPLRPVRARFNHPSLHSIRSLPKVTSIHSIIKKSLSKDFYKKKPSSSIQHTQSKNNSPKTPPNTVIRQQKRASKRQFQINKEDLLNNLFLQKRPDQGGYDPDAQILDDVARNIGKKSPGKRPSIHSVDWITTPGSKSTPESSRGRTSADPERDLHPYDIHKKPLVSTSDKFNKISSTPNLRSNPAIARGRKLRRSHSTVSMGLPQPLALSPLHIPSLGGNNTAGKICSETSNEGLRLSCFPVPPGHISAQTSRIDLSGGNYLEHSQTHHHQEEGNASAILSSACDIATDSAVPCPVKIRTQQPTLSATSGLSTSTHGTLDEISPSATVVHLGRSQNKEDDNESLRSVHLHSMRISHHLRSGSLLSWDKLATAPDIPDLHGAPGDCSRTESVQTSRENQQRSRYNRQTSSSGISSCKIPARWGKVVRNDTFISSDSASSVYSYRPQSLPESLHGSMGALLCTSTENQYSRPSSSNMQKLIRSTTFPTGNAEMPSSTQRHSLATVMISSSDSARTLPHAPLTAPLPCKNSVADTKVSKFREEFSPPAPKRRLNQSSPIIKFLNSKRLGLRSQSDTSLRSGAPIPSVDGPSDVLDVPADRQRRQSQSLVSMRTEQNALGKNKGANQVWDRALQAHQEEKASLFLPKNKDLAVHASPFRERSGSISTKRVSVDEPDLSVRSEGSNRRLSLSPSHAPDDHCGVELPLAIFRRKALASSDESEPGQNLANVYERQGDGHEVVGAWGRYPSHTRYGRVGSAGKADSVQPRDFALEAGIDSASTKDEEDMIGPTQRRPSTPLLLGEKKKKKRIGSGRIMRSSSMTLGRALMKNYGKMFKSQNTEFRRHGRGHRSSIASGGILEHPELELLPQVWSGDFTGNVSTGALENRDESVTQDYASKNAAKGKGGLIAEELMTTHHQRRNSSAPNLTEPLLSDGTAESEHAPDGASIWYGYYKNCLDTYPWLSTDANTSAEDVGPLTGLYRNNEQASVQSSMMRGHLKRHSQNASGMSHTSQANKCISIGENNCAAEVKSLCSVRRSTVDLISKFQDQKAIEHARILALENVEAAAAL